MGSSLSRRERRKYQRLLGEKKAGNEVYDLMMEKGRKLHREYMQAQKNLELKQKKESESEDPSKIDFTEKENQYSNFLDFLQNSKNNEDSNKDE